LKSLSIADTAISNSSQFGLEINGGFWSNRISSTELFLKNCLINESGTHGIYTYSSRISDVKIVNSTVTKNGYRSRPWNNHYGIYLQLYSPANVLLANSEISETWKKGVYIYSPYGDNVIRIINSSIVRSGDCGLTLPHFAGRFFAAGNIIAWNKKGAVSLSCNYYYYHQPAMRFYSNSFFHNEGPTVEIYGRSNSILEVMNNDFRENRGGSAIAFGRSYYYHYKATAIVSRNIFMSNNCTDKGVIDIRRNAADFVLKENDFISNTGRCVLLEGTAAVDHISMTDNLFIKNDCEDKSVIEAQRVERNSTVANNTFAKNVANSVVLIQVIHSINPSLKNAEFILSNNTLSDNSAHNLSRRSAGEDLCALIISGFLYYKDVTIHYNRFNNSKYPKELCIRVPSISQRDVVNVTLNWWGTAIGSEVRQRISDFDDNYDFAIAKDWPFLLSRDDSTLISLTEHDFMQHGHVLSGRLFESMTLRASQIPYHVTADLTVLENVSLVIEPGVTVEISPRVSILVAGDLQARGTLAKPIRFTVKETTKRHGFYGVPVRLVGGDFPWEGRVEVFHNKSWKAITAASNFSTSTVREIVCKQLEYGPPEPSLESLVKLGEHENGSCTMDIHCHGNETFLHECQINYPEFNCSNSPTVVKCKGESWGNVRFISPRDVNISQEKSTLEHVVFSYCGHRHGMSVAAIEAVINVPVMRFVTVKSCIAGGLRVHFPQTGVHLSNSKLVNTGVAGINFLQTRRNIVVENCEAIRNKRGISIDESREDNVPRVFYGRAFLCGENKAIFLKNYTILYFEIPLMVKVTAPGTCQKVLTVTKGQGIRMKISYVKGTQRLNVYDFHYGYNSIVDKSNDDLAPLVHKELFIPRDTIRMKWTGDVNSQMVVEIEETNLIGELFSCCCRHRNAFKNVFLKETQTSSGAIP